MLQLTIIDILGYPNGILDLEKGFYKTLKNINIKNIPAVSQD